jgi:hypothetical protein
MLLAGLMLLTGGLGQVGHGWAHGGGADASAAWLAALQAEREWLTGGAADARMRDNRLSNRVFQDHDDIIDHCCHGWRRLVDQPWRVMSIGLPDWAHRF